MCHHGTSCGRKAGRQARLGRQGCSRKEADTKLVVSKGCLSILLLKCRSKSICAWSTQILQQVLSESTKENTDRVWILPGKHGLGSIFKTVVTEELQHLLITGQFVLHDKVLPACQTPLISRITSFCMNGRELFLSIILLLLLLFQAL